MVDQRSLWEEAGLRPANGERADHGAITGRDRTLRQQHWNEVAHDQPQIDDRDEDRKAALALMLVQLSRDIYSERPPQRWLDEASSVIQNTL